MPKLKPNVVIDPSTYRRYKVVYLPDGRVEFVEVLPPRTARGSGSGNGNTAPQAPEPYAIPDIDPAFKARLSSVLTDNKYDRQLARRKSGKLSMQGLWRVSTGANNVFSQKLARQGKHYNVVLLVDQSGSMMGNRLKFAAAAALFLGRHFEAIDIDYSVIGFASEAAVYKSLDKPQGDWEELALELLNPEDEKVGGGTDIAAGLAKTLEQLNHQSGKHLVIVLTDGDTEHPSEVRRIIHGNSPRIEFLGVGLNHSCEVIADNIRIDYMAQLQPSILKWLQTKIRRGV